MRAKLIPLSHCALNSFPRHSIAVYAGERIDNTRFNADVTELASAFLQLKAEQFALYFEQAYPFCVNLFALLHSHKKVWVAANNTELTADKLSERGCLLLGDWKGKELSVEQNKANSLKLALLNFEPLDLEPLNLDKVSVTLFTSGSSGQAKAISKSLQQLQAEIETLENYWGKRLGQADVLATVSHQHIYGLLFRVLWPLVSGRCFHSEMYLSPEPLLKIANTISAYWVASPAQLKRLDEFTPWQEISRLLAIFSSGGVLPTEAAIQIHKRCNHKVQEIYGSTETGGIAWRQCVDNELWKPFNGINITVDDECVSRLTSPFLRDRTAFILDDRIQLAENGRFALLRRMDRIVKVEEKRLSLDELEQSLNASDWIQQSHTLLLAKKRDKIGAILVLTKSGKLFLQQQGRVELIKAIRQQLMLRFENVVLPRKWLFIQSLPLNAQGKINRELLLQLLSLDTTRSPQILLCDYKDETVELQLRIPPGLVYFSGHFPGQPILPGVAQLAWVEQFGKLFFNIALPFLRMEVIKFKKIIRPEDIIQMKLIWNADSNKLYFELSSVSSSHSSGRMVYGEQE
jgi:acyl-coenzyme A synthetase/AMP-(fatty) acid ligase